MTRRLSSVAACAALVALVLAGTANPAAAKKPKGKQPDAFLAPPEAGPDMDAEGTIRVKTKKHTSKLVIKLKHLAAKTRYEVRDADTDALLGSVRTNRKGKARLKVKLDIVGTAKTDEGRELADDVVIVDENGVLVLRTNSEGEDGATRDDEPAADGAPGIGFAHYETRDGSHGSAFLMTMPDAGIECIGVSFQPVFDPETDEAIELHDYFVEVMGEDDRTELPLGVESVRELAERAFQIVDGRGAVVLEGDLPALEDLRVPDFPMFPMPFPGGDVPFDFGGGTDRGSDPGNGFAAGFPFDGPRPLFAPEELEPTLYLLIADEAGDFVRVGPMMRTRLPTWGDGGPWFGGDRPDQPRGDGGDAAGSDRGDAAGTDRNTTDAR